MRDSVFIEFQRNSADCVEVLTCYLHASETEEDRKKTVDPILLFPWREWIASCLPGGKSFSWDLEHEPANEVEEIEITERVNCLMFLFEVHASFNFQRHPTG